MLLLSKDTFFPLKSPVTLAPSCKLDLDLLGCIIRETTLSFQITTVTSVVNTRFEQIWRLIVCTKILCLKILQNEIAIVTNLKTMGIQ